MNFVILISFHNSLYLLLLYKFTSVYSYVLIRTISLQLVYFEILYIMSIEMIEN